MTPYVYAPDKPRTAANYPLIGNPHRHFYPSRNLPILLAVNHITAGLDDYDGDDSSAEATLRYSSTTSVQASYTGIVDSDSIIDCLPDDYTAWAQGVRGYNFNSPALSLEIGKRTTDWTKAPADWVEATLRNAARWWAPRVKRYSIPLRLVTDRDQIQRMIDARTPVGFTEHWNLSPATRSDAGRVGDTTTFPWARFFDLVREELGQAPSSGGTQDGPTVVIPKPSRPRFVPLWTPTGKLSTAQVQGIVGVTADGLYGQATKAAVAVYQRDKLRVTADGLWGDATEAAHFRYAARRGLVVDGVLGPATWRALQQHVGATVDGIYGPNTRRALQRWLGVNVDGIVGKVTIKALQAKVGATVDGYWGEATTRALQDYLNEAS